MPLLIQLQSALLLVSEGSRGASGSCNGGGAPSVDCEVAVVVVVVLEGDEDDFLSLSSEPPWATANHITRPKMPRVISTAVGLSWNSVFFPVDVSGFGGVAPISA